MKKVNRIMSLAMSALVAMSAISCNGSMENPTDSNEALESNDVPNEIITDTVYELEYVYPSVDYKDYSFKILNYAEQYGCYVKLNVDEMTGETVDDAVYARNNLVEDKLNINIEEITLPYPGWPSLNTIIKTLQQSIMADDNAYDAAYLPLSFGSSIITEGYLVDLNSIKELQLNERWWDTNLNKNLEINGRLYCATSPLHLMSLDLSWVLLFNKNLFDNNKVEYPYDLVREGKWTLDKMNEYVTKLTTLNDESFEFDPKGKSIYGVAGHTSAPTVMLIAAGNNYIESDSDNKLTLNTNTERFYNSIDKINQMLSVDSGKCLYGNAGIDVPGSYLNLFVNDRAAFVTTELKGTLALRNMSSDFGIIPMPKLNETQENHITYTSENVCRLVIPKTNDDLARTGTILDVLSYESYMSVLPLYFNQTISQKGLRDEDSIEMLNLINAKRKTDMGMIFGITNTLVESIQNMIINGEDNASSIISANQDAVNQKLQNIITTLNK